MASPTVATIKRLFAVSGHTCNFKDCVVPIVDDHGTVVVDVAHMAAASRGGPRYDAGMTEEERHGFDNLILVCPTHHRQIDGAPEAFPLGALRAMKTAAAGVAEINLSEETVQAILRASRTGGAVVSIGQTGGQTAQTIVNVGTPTRSIPVDTAEDMVATLAPHADQSIGFASYTGDPEAASYKRALMHVFARAGWEVVDQNGFMFFGDKSGVLLTVGQKADEAAPAVQAAARALDLTGQLLGGNRGDMANERGLCVQVWPAKR